MTLEESVLATGRQLLRGAEQSGNVSATYRLYNVSRAQFYQWRAAWCEVLGTQPPCLLPPV